MAAEWTDIVQALAGVVGTIIGASAVVQIRILRKEIQHDHARSRRERAIELVQRWAADSSTFSPACRYLVEGFDNHQCAALVSREQVYISDADKAAAEDALSPLIRTIPLVLEAGKGLRLDAEHVDHLGKNCVAFLNALEVPLEAWLNNIADRQIIERQLEYVVKAKVGKRGFAALECFRDALQNLDNGRDKYPATREFVRHIRSKAEKPLVPQSPTGSV